MIMVHITIAIDYLRCFKVEGAAVLVSAAGVVSVQG